MERFLILIFFFKFNQTEDREGVVAPEKNEKLSPFRVRQLEERPQASFQPFGVVRAGPSGPWRVTCCRSWNEDSGQHGD